MRSMGMREYGDEGVWGWGSVGMRECGDEGVWG